MFLLAPLRYLAEAVSAKDSPRQMAAGFAIGALAGLIPKSSLLAHAALLALSVFEVNMGAGLLGACLFTAASPLFVPLTHRLGLLLLTGVPALRPLWTFLYNLPIVPWTAFNNTVVLGSFVLGAAALWPLYLGTQPLFERWQAAYGEKIRKFWLVRLLAGAQTAAKVGGGQ